LWGSGHRQDVRIGVEISLGGGHQVFRGEGLDETRETPQIVQP
jgi:hypothetical protein